MYRIGYHTDSDDGRTEPTGARTLKTAIREAKKMARRFAPVWEYAGYGPYWRVLDATTGEVLAGGRL